MREWLSSRYSEFRRLNSEYLNSNNNIIERMGNFKWKTECYKLEPLLELLLLSAWALRALLSVTAS